MELLIDASPLPPVRLGYDARLRSVSVGYQRSSWQSFTRIAGAGTDGDARDGWVPRVPRARPGGLLPRRVLQVGVRLAVFNGLLHGLWAVGGLSFDATPLIPEALGGLVDGVQVDGRIQPVITGEPAGEADLQLSLGQLEIRISSAGVTDVYAANLRAGITLRVGGNEVGAEVDAEPTLRVWPMELQSARSLISADVLESLIREQMWPELRRAVSQSLIQRIRYPTSASCQTLPHRSRVLVFSLRLRANRGSPGRDRS